MRNKGRSRVHDSKRGRSAFGHFPSTAFSDRGERCESFPTRCSRSKMIPRQKIGP
jgi:hypothetical protein